MTDDPSAARHDAMAPPLRVAERRGRITLAVTMAASGMAFLDGTVVNVALRRIGLEYEVGLAGLQWVVNSYLLALAALILLGGSLGDRLGRRRVFTVGVAVFTVASAACGLAPTLELLIVARVVQGVGGALLTPGSLAILQASFAPEDRTRAIGIWSASAGLTSAIGPLLGGWLVDAVSWRAVFLINVPIAVGVLRGVRHVPETRDEAATGRVDWPGAVAAATGLGLITWGFVRAGEHGLDGPATAAFGAGVVAFVAFVLIEWRSPSPMVPLSMFRSRVFSGLNLFTLLVWTGLAGVTFLLVLQLQVNLGYSPLAAGLALAPLSIGLLVLSPIVGAWSQRHGVRAPMVVGTLLAAVGCGLLAGTHPGDGFLVDVLPGSVLLAVGMGLVVAPLTAGVLAAVEDRRVGVASGVNNAVARAAGLFAVAALPVLAGMGGAELRDGTVLDAGYGRAMWIVAGLMAVGAVVAVLTTHDVRSAHDEP